MSHGRKSTRFNTDKGEELGNVNVPLTEDMRSFISRAINESTQVLLEKITSLEGKIESLEDAIKEKQLKIDMLERDMNIVMAVNKQLVIANDNLEQYGRRFNIQVENVSRDPGETNESLKTKIVDILVKAGANIDKSNIVRHHRSSRVKVDERDRNVPPPRNWPMHSKG